MSVKPSLPKGTRDILPEMMLKREHILEVIRSTFKKFGFLPIETPAMENLSTLTGKYGEEGDRLIFKILNSGDFLRKSNSEAYDIQDSIGFGVSISEKALKYDLTVPFARFVVQNQNELYLPFKRYQIQPVWRADRPQKGRFREFYQCDADIVGSNSLLLELEFIKIYRDVFKELNLPVTIKFNNRKLLAGLAVVYDISDRLVDFTVALDKLDKIGKEGVTNELQAKGFSNDAITGFERISNLGGSSLEKLNELKNILNASEIGRKGIEEVSFMLENLSAVGLEKVSLELDLTLARGLDYYTGAIFEVTADGVELGSIGGGGRYDDLTGIFGLKGLSGIGISFGLDRIQIALESLDLFPDLGSSSTEVLFANFGEKEALHSLKLANELRDLGVKAEVYPDGAKLKKQLDFANKKNISKVVLVGSNEMANGSYVVKDMNSGEQGEYTRTELLESFSKINDLDYGRH